MHDAAAAARGGSRRRRWRRARPRCRTRHGGPAAACQLGAPRRGSQLPGQADCLLCNDPIKDGPQHDGAYNASRAPFFGLYDHNGAPDGAPRAVAWRCYSHGCLNPTTHRFDKSIAGPPSGASHASNATACNIATDVGPGALQAICATCAGTTIGVSNGQCLPAPHILESAPKRLPIQRAAGRPLAFTVTGNFTTTASTAATCRVNEQPAGILEVLNASVASCEIPCDPTSAAVNQSAGCWLQT